jgi:hypothetical protein
MNSIRGYEVGGEDEERRFDEFHLLLLKEFQKQNRNSFGQLSKLMARATLSKKLKDLQKWGLLREDLDSSDYLATPLIKNEVFLATVANYIVSTKKNVVAFGPDVFPKVLLVSDYQHIEQHMTKKPLDLYNEIMKLDQAILCARISSELQHHGIDISSLNSFLQKIGDYIESNYPNLNHRESQILKNSRNFVIEVKGGTIKGFAMTGIWSFDQMRPRTPKAKKILRTLKRDQMFHKFLNFNECLGNKRGVMVIQESGLGEFYRVPEIILALEGKERIQTEEIGNSDSMGIPSK